MQSARFEEAPGTVMVKDRPIKFARGEIVASYRYLVNRWRWSLGRVTNYLDYLEGENMISRRQAAGQTIISLTNYLFYNGGAETQQGTLFPKSKQKTDTATGTPTDTATGTPTDITDNELRQPQEQQQEHQAIHSQEHCENSGGYKSNNVLKKDKNNTVEKKVFFRENIALLPAENEKLVAEHGQEKTDACYDYLNDYKIEKGAYQTKSDYLTIKRWVLDAVGKKVSQKPPANGFIKPQPVY